MAPSDSGSASRRPDEIRAQPFVDGPAVIGPRHAGRRIVERVVGRRGERRVEPHQVRHDGADAVLFVIQHDRRPAFGAGAQFQRAIGIVCVEWLPVQPGGVVDRDIAMVEERHMRGWLSGNALADRAVAGVVVNRIVVGMRVNVIASAVITMCHISPRLAGRPTPHGAGRACDTEKLQLVQCAGL